MSEIEGQYKLQISGKVLGDLVVVRADSAEEFAETLGSLSEHSEAIVKGWSDFKQIGVANGILTGDATSERSSGSSSSGGWKKSGTTRKADASPSSKAPSCEHGPMKDFADRGYKHRYYCAGPRGEQCDARD